MWSAVRGLLELTVGLATLAKLFDGVSSLSEVFAKFSVLDDFERVGVVVLAFLVVDSLARIRSGLHDGTAIAPGTIFARGKRTTTGNDHPPSSSSAASFIAQEAQKRINGLSDRTMRSRTSQGTDSEKPPADDSMARQLSEGFAEAARQAVRGAHSAGLAVPARKGGVAVEIRPDGDVVPIDENATWSPTGWRKSAKR